MFAELNELLGASPQRPEPGRFTLLRDSRTDGSFLVHHFLSFYLRAGCKVCFVALLQSFSHYNIVAQKLGVNLTAAKERGQLVFLEGLKSCLDLVFGEEEEQPGQPSPLLFLRKSPSDLRALFEFVHASLSAPGSEAWAGPVLLVDDLSVLLSLGATPVAVLDFIHYCRACLCCQLKGNVVVLVHSSEESEDEENELVVNSLCHHSDLILWAEGLATGFCKDVHGQIKIIQRVSLQQPGEQDLIQIYQYKIQDRNVTFFARGLSAAVL
ncbi:elongator complex protein 6 isoform X1 [Neopelma chrysocephalum]|uniref:elongator complex protein 6 isoform X1 n=1 Tax=Neopelma chrysocephalum TaxID=114329 RepID=UPI000FCD0361|nr:elongator complex protein 6 isoform X1 [Neopelma chrysocephalum]